MLNLWVLKSLLLSIGLRESISFLGFSLVRTGGEGDFCVCVSFRADTPAEIALVERLAVEAGADAAVATNHWAEGGKGAIDLANAVIKACEGDSSKDFKFLYSLDLSLKDKIEKISKEMYGAEKVTYSDEAEKQIVDYERQGFGGFPVCMAKTHLSLSADAKVKGRPTGEFVFPKRVFINVSSAYGLELINHWWVYVIGFTIPIRTIKMSAGAGFLYPIVGDM